MTYDEMYDELVRALRKQAHDLPEKFSRNAENIDLFLKAADAIEELQKQLQKSEEDNVNLTGWLAEEHAKHLWIPVTERVPLLTTPVLVTDGIEVDISWVYGVPPRWITSYTAIDEDKLTHWMPLPQTPKEAEEGE